MPTPEQNPEASTPADIIPLSGTTVNFVQAPDVAPLPETQTPGARKKLAQEPTAALNALGPILETLGH